MKKYEDEVMAGYVEPAVLTEAVAWLLESGGCTAAIAREVAHNLVEAEMAGHGSHGARQMMLYLERLRSGAVDGHARPTIEEDQIVTVVHFSQIVEPGLSGYGAVPSPN